MQFLKVLQFLLGFHQTLQSRHICGRQISGCRLDAVVLDPSHRLHQSLFLLTLGGQFFNPGVKEGCHLPVFPFLGKVINDPAQF